MTGHQTKDVVMIGAGVGGLVAATYLARAGLSVCVLEARSVVGGLCVSAALGDDVSGPVGAHSLYAIDPTVMKDLQLARHGLRFAVRNMPLVGLQRDGRHLVIGHDVHATSRALLAHSKEDAEAWPRLHREFHGTARALRPYWFGKAGADVLRRQEARLAPIRAMGVSAWLDEQFESRALKATLAFDALCGSLSPLEPGSALTLLWRAAQQMCGLQAAGSMLQGGPGALVNALASAATEVRADIRVNARVARIHVSGDGVAGVELASGESIAARRVLSCLSRRRTLCELLPDGEAGFAVAARCHRMPARTTAAKVMLVLDARPRLDGIVGLYAGRFVLADRLETYAAAYDEACAGRMPSDPPIEVVLPSVADPTLAPEGRHVLSALVRPLPVAPAGGWPEQKAKLLRIVLAALAPHVADIARRVIHAEVLTPEDFRTSFDHEDERNCVAHILSDWDERIRTPVKGLLLCGAAAEPVPSISGRAGRIAAELVWKDLSP